MNYDIKCAYIGVLRHGQKIYMYNKISDYYVAYVMGISTGYTLVFGRR